MQHSRRSAEAAADVPGGRTDRGGRQSGGDLGGLSAGQGYSQAGLSLVQLLQYCALIGPELHSNEIFS